MDRSSSLYKWESGRMCGQIFQIISVESFSRNRGALKYRIEEIKFENGKTVGGKAVILRTAEKTEKSFTDLYMPEAIMK